MVENVKFLLGLWNPSKIILFRHLSDRFLGNATVLGVFAQIFQAIKQLRAMAMNPAYENHFRTRITAKYEIDHSGTVPLERLFR